MYNEDYATRPPEGLTVEEMNLCTIIHDNEGSNKYQLFIIAFELYGWSSEKFCLIYNSLIGKGAILQEG